MNIFMIPLNFIMVAPSPLQLKKDEILVTVCTLLYFYWIINETSSLAQLILRWNDTLRDGKNSTLLPYFWGVCKNDIGQLFKS